MKDFIKRNTVAFFLMIFLGLVAWGCGKKDSTEITLEKARQDSLLALIRSAQDRSIQGASRIINPSNSAQQKKFTSFSDSATKSVHSVHFVQKKPSAVQVQDSKKAGTSGKSDTASTLASAIETNAKIIKVDSGSAEDKRLDSLMLIANTLSYRYQQMIMTHTHRNLAEQAHQNPAKTRRLLNKITEAAPDRFLRSKKAGEVRSQRLQELQNRMQGQGQAQRPDVITQDSGR